MGIFESSGKTSNPLGGTGVLVGLLGAGCSVVLWIYRFQPNSTILGKYAAQMTAGGPLVDQLRLLAGFLGVMAVIAGIVGGMGGRGSATTVGSLLLGIVALTYPVMTYLNLVTRLVPAPIR
jgi:hypothetical protein